MEKRERAKIRSRFLILSGSRSVVVRWEIIGTWFLASLGE